MHFPIEHTIKIINSHYLAATNDQTEGFITITILDIIHPPIFYLFDFYI
jgi:hypothetical protein